jgi:hypothetical protein
MSERQVLDLWPISKIVSQRQKICRGTRREFLADEMKNLFAMLLATPTLERARQFYVTEEIWLAHPLTRPNAKSFGLDVFRAVLSGDFKVSRPENIKTVGLGFDPEWGFVYLATSSGRLGQIKVGVTTYDPHIRLAKFKSKFGESIRLVRAWELDFPARIERHVQNSLREFRVSGNSLGESIEWYECSVICAEEAVDSCVNEFRESVRDAGDRFESVDISGRVFELLCEIYSESPELVSRLRDIDFALVIAGLRQALDAVTDSERLLLIRLYGIDEAPRYTLHQFAYLNDFSVDRVKKLHDSVFRKLRHPSRAVALIRLLDQT